MARPPTAEEITPQTPHVVALEAIRRTAASIAEQILPYYEVAYPDDRRLHELLPLAVDYAAGRVDERTLADAASLASAAFDDANRMAETCNITTVARHWAAADVAEAVLETLSPVVDLIAVRRLAEDARSRFILSKHGRK